MCLYVKQGEYIKKAENDILCFKQVQPADDKNTMWTGIYQNCMEYNYNTEVVADHWLFDIESKSRKLIKLTHLMSVGEQIYEGFHARTIKLFDSDKYCIIPKGAEICYGDLNEIVATSMIVFKNNRQYRKYKIKYKIKKIWENLKQSLSKPIQTVK